MKEVRCIVVHGNTLNPMRVLVPEVEGSDPERMVGNIVRAYSGLRFGISIITGFVDDLGQKIMNIIDWGSSKIVDPTPKDPATAFKLFQVVNGSGRCKELEPLIAEDENNAQRYASLLPKTSWASWTDEELSRSPCWLFIYAQQVMKGKLPENLHSAMAMHSFQSPQNLFVKKYFKMRRYKYHCKKNLRGESFYKESLPAQ